MQISFSLMSNVPCKFSFIGTCVSGQYLGDVFSIIFSNLFPCTHFVLEG